MSPPEKSRVRDRYDELGGKLYDIRYIEEQKEKYEHIFTHLDRGKTLDNGCGTGLFLPYLDEHSVGLDLSSGLLQEARGRAGKRLVLSSLKCVYSEEAFEKLVKIGGIPVVMVNTVENINDWVAVIRNTR